MDHYKDLSDQFKRQRMELLRVANELKESHGCKVYVSSDLLKGGRILFFDVVKDEKATTVGFSCREDRWYIVSFYGRTSFTASGSIIPFGCMEVLDALKPCNIKIGLFLSEL